MNIIRKEIKKTDNRIEKYLEILVNKKEYIITELYINDDIVRVDFELNCEDHFEIQEISFNKNNIIVIHIYDTINRCSHIYSLFNNIINKQINNDNNELSFNYFDEMTLHNIFIFSIDKEYDKIIVELLNYHNKSEELKAYIELEEKLIKVNGFLGICCNVVYRDALSNNNNDKKYQEYFINEIEKHNILNQIYLIVAYFQCYVEKILKITFESIYCKNYDKESIGYVCGLSNNIYILRKLFYKKIEYINVPDIRKINEKFKELFDIKKFLKIEDQIIKNKFEEFIKLRHKMAHKGEIDYNIDEEFIKDNIKIFLEISRIIYKTYKKL